MPINNKENVKGYIISESVTSATPTIISDKSGQPTVIETILQEGDIENRNKRIYPTDVIKKGLTGEYVQERLATKSWMGEAGHPMNPTLERQLYIDQSNISHIITSVNWKDNLLFGTVETALTERGRDMQGLIRQGTKVAFSLRAYGPVCQKQGDITYVRDPLHILTYDWILHPSHRPAYMQAIISEGATIFEQKRQEKLLAESGYFIPVTQSTMANYVLNESSSIKNMLEQYEFGDNNLQVNVDSSKKIIYFKEASDILACYLEDYIAYDLDKYMSQI